MLKRYQSGQALVLILLSLSVVLTLVLFILSRSVTDISLTTSDEESVRAFSAAEAGIEKALIAGSATGSFVSGSSFNASVSEFAEGSNSFVLPSNLSAGDSSTVWLISHDTGNDTLGCSPTLPCFASDSIKVCWGKEGTDANSATAPALEATIFYLTTPGDYSTARIARAVFDPNSSRLSSNNFSATDVGTCSIQGTNFAFQKTISLSSLGISTYATEGSLQFVKLKTFYNGTQSHNVGVDVSATGDSLPSQGQEIISTGVAGDANRRVRVFQGWPEPPQIFDFAIFSSSGINK